MKLKKLAIVALILSLTIESTFAIDISGTLSIAKTFVIDTADKFIPGTRAQFENIDAQISGAIVKNGANETLAADSSPKSKAAPSKRPVPATAGRKAYVNPSNMNAKAVSELRMRLIVYGMTLRGIPYRLGSENPSSGFDCSGFVRYAVKNGINVQLPRTAREMYSAVAKIPTSQLEPGDLVFFRNFGKIDHVGIYLGKYQGKGRLHGRRIFLNSASEGPRTGVVVSALDEPYWKQHYSSAGRFLPSYSQAAR